MKKQFLTFIFAAVFSVAVNAQSGRGIRIGYIDMEYILQNVPDYIEGKNQLELKAQKWKQEAEVKKGEITKLKDALKTERVLLTKELIEEREEEIAFLETELSDFQQKRFGPNGDLYVQRAVLVKPIQDQVFTTVQDIAEIKKYDFVFDKSSDLTMLFAAKRYDMSDQVIRALTRSARRTQMSKKEIKEEEAKEYRENLQDENPDVAERQKKLDQKKADREKLLADRKAAAEERKAAADEKRKQMMDERAAKKNGTAVPNTSDTNENASKEKPAGESANKEVKETNTAARDSAVASREATKKANAEARAKILEDRKKALEEKKAKALADREAAKKAKEQKAAETAPK